MKNEIVSVEAKHLPAEQMSRETAELIFTAIPDNTIRAYRNAYNKMTEWLSGRINTDALLADYVTHLFNQGYAPATIQIAVAAANWVARWQGRDKVSGTITKETLHAIRVNDSKTRTEKGKGTARRGQVSGLTWEDVHRVCELAEHSNTIAGLRDSALIQLMSDGLLRVSEAVAVNCSHLRGKSLYVPRSKNDQEGRGKSLHVTGETREAITTYRQRAGIDSGAVFRRIRKGDVVTRERLTATSARRIIKKWAQRAGFEGVSGHSMRVGSAVSLAQKNASLVEMQQAGRWKDPKMPAHYAEQVLSEQGAIAKYKDKENA